MTISEANLVAPPATPLIPAAWALERIGLESPSGAQIDAVDRMLRALTGAFESVTGRLLVKRTNLTLLFDGCDWLAGDVLRLNETIPVIQIASVHVDRSAADPIDVVFDETTVIDPADWLLLRHAPATSWAPWTLDLRSTVHPNGFGRRNVQLVLDAGFTPSDGASDFSPPLGEFAVPPTLIEAALQQFELVWRQRGRLHLQSETTNFAGGGGGTTSYWSAKLAKSVREALAPLATPEAAVNLGQGFSASAAGQA